MILCPQCGISEPDKEWPTLCSNCGGGDSIEFAEWAKAEIKKLRSSESTKRDMTTQLVTDVSVGEARKAHAKMVLGQILNNFDTVEMTGYEFNNIGISNRVKFTFTLDNMYVIKLEVSL